MKKIYIFLIIVALLITSYLIILYIPKNYTLDYAIDKVKILEKFNKKLNQYSFVLTYEDQEYPFFLEKNYERKRKLINKVNTIKDDNDTCLVVDIKDTKKVLCRDKNGLKDYRTINEKLYNDNFPIENENELISTYKNIDIYNKDYTYLIWNYKGYIVLNDKSSNLDIFEKEKYSNIETFTANEYLIIPDYDSSYYFKKIYIYNTQKEKLNTIEFNYEISYNLFSLGIYKNKTYFLDLKNKNEYEIDLKKNKIRLINEKDNDGIFYKNNKKEVILVNSLVKNPQKFITKNLYNYKLEGSTLYQILDNYKIKITNKKVETIITTLNDTVFYISEDTLYKYNYNEGEKRILSNKEWKFNFQNSVFIFNK